MVMDESEATQAYKEGLERVTERAFREAKGSNTVMGAAQPLEDAAPNSEVDFDEYAKAYSNKYE